MTNVAIACQGGGSHTAFTAGVLDEVLPWLEAHDCELVGLSGTSGGAVSAAAAWNGYVEGGAGAACDRLDAIWADIVVSNPWERAANDWFVGLLAAQNAGAPVPTLSPYALPLAAMGTDRFRRILERNLDFDRFPAMADGTAPHLVVGTVNVEAGEFETFTDADVTSDAILASAAIPRFFEAVQINGHAHWDGLFSQNPPIDDLMAVDAARKPDEIWIVQVNPQTADSVPRSLGAINDRRQELSGNISLNQEVRFIERVNDWIESGDLAADRYKHVEVRKVVLDRELGYSSKFRRTRGFVEDLVAEGRETAAEFVDEIEADLHGHEYH